MGFLQGTERDLFRKVISLVRDASPQEGLLKWYAKYGRSFLWRQRSTPFAVLIAEILLKKTTASAVEHFIPAFLTRHPDPFSITESTIWELKDLLTPLGLSAQRADQIWNLAGALIQRHNGQVPSELKDLLDLPGVGPYIASAVRCYAFSCIEAPVDTNVARVLVRFYGLIPSRHEARRSPEVWSSARELVGQNVETVRKMNWAILDLGAQICTPREPKCSSCPLASWCEFSTARGICKLRPT